MNISTIAPIRKITIIIIVQILFCTEKKIIRSIRLQIFKIHFLK